jgi:hypothetical protein
MKHGPFAEFIGIVGCTDKAVVFEKSTIGIEPFSYFIVNLPEPLRHVTHLGNIIVCMYLCCTKHCIGTYYFINVF